LRSAAAESFLFQSFVQGFDKKKKSLKKNHGVILFFISKMRNNYKGESSEICESQGKIDKEKVLGLRSGLHDSRCL